MRYTLALILSVTITTPALAVDPTGIAQCDAFLKRYEHCSNLLNAKQIHAAQKELLESAMSMRAAANNPAVRADLERFCQDRFEQMKKKSDIAECMAKLD
jgi:hypothetical protein